VSYRPFAGQSFSRPSYVYRSPTIYRSPVPIYHAPIIVHSMPQIVIRPRPTPIPIFTHSHSSAPIVVHNYDSGSPVWQDGGDPSNGIGIFIAAVFVIAALVAAFFWWRSD
jgi:hypothetical protein